MRRNWDALIFKNLNDIMVSANLRLLAPSLPFFSLSVSHFPYRKEERLFKILLVHQLVDLPREGHGLESVALNVRGHQYQCILKEERERGEEEEGREKKRGMEREEGRERKRNRKREKDGDQESVGLL